MIIFLICLPPWPHASLFFRCAQFINLPAAFLWVTLSKQKDYVNVPSFCHLTPCTSLNNGGRCPYPWFEPCHRDSSHSVFIIQMPSKVTFYKLGWNQLLFPILQIPNCPAWLYSLSFLLAVSLGLFWVYFKLLNTLLNATNSSQYMLLTLCFATTIPRVTGSFVTSSASQLVVNKSDSHLSNMDQRVSTFWLQSPCCLLSILKPQPHGLGYFGVVVMWLYHFWYPFMYY